jgi:Uma2 family endonuclease
MTIRVETESTYGIFHDVSWDYYTHTIDEFTGRKGVRIAYDEGTMEIMTTSDYHEFVKTVVARLIEAYSMTRKVRMSSRGQPTLRKALVRKGLEPDACFYVRTRPPRPRMGEMDLDQVPPPDLVLEVEISRGTLPKRPIYAALGVAELWRFDLSGQKVVPLHLQSDGSYSEREESLNFPGLPLGELNRFLRQALDAGDEYDAIEDWQAYLRGE